jgi:hypothetical protein
VLALITQVLVDATLGVAEWVAARSCLRAPLLPSVLPVRDEPGALPNRLSSAGYTVAPPSARHAGIGC